MTTALRLAQLVIADPKAAVSMASRIVTQEKARRARKAAKSKPRRAIEEAERDADRARHLGLVSQVLFRADHHCELCCVVARGVLQLHHLEGGPKKSAHERISNVMAVHPDCHEAYHMNVAAFVPRVKLWCDQHGYSYPNRKEYRTP